MSSSLVHTTFTGAPPIAFEHKAASTAKSGFDLRPKPPPKRVTLTVTFSDGRLRYEATMSCAACGLCTLVHTSALPSTIRHVADGGSIVACALCGM